MITTAIVKAPEGSPGPPDELREARLGCNEHRLAYNDDN